MEAACKVERIAVEEQIIALVEDAPEKGNRTLRGDSWRATVKFGISYKVDVDAIRKLDGEAADHLPLKLIPQSWKLDEKAYEALRETRPDLFAKVAACVTSKPKKVSVELKA